MELKDFSSPQPAGAVAVIVKPGTALPDGVMVTQQAVLVARKDGKTWIWIPISKIQRQAIEEAWIAMGGELHKWYWACLS